MAQSSTTYTTTYTSAPVRTVKTERTPLRGKVRDSTGCCGDVCDMAAFEYRADVKDLELDGRHWRELFGGATGGGTKMGAYIICGPNAFVLFRIFLAMCATGIFCWTLVHGFKTDTQGYWALYFTNWTVTISCAYFMLAAALTSYAVCTNGQESRSTPFLVWFCWILYGMLVPSAQIAFLAYWLVIFDGTVYAVSIAATVGTLVIVLLDMWINRQPYYYSFHAIFGVTIKCATAAPPAPASGLAARGPRPSSMRSQKQRPPPPTNPYAVLSSPHPSRLLTCSLPPLHTRSLVYLLFTVIYWAADGKDFFNNPYIYRAVRRAVKPPPCPRHPRLSPTARAALTPHCHCLTAQLSWERPMSAGKLVLLILFVLCPCFNCLFWFLIWARRRVLVAAKTPSVLS